MPVNNQLYKSIVPMRNDATRTYSREHIEPINAEQLYVTIGGKKVLKSSLNQRDDSLTEIPSNYIANANKKDAILEKIGWQDKAGKPAGLQGLAKTVGASAAMATGAAYSSPVVGSLSALAKNIIAGGVGMEGFAMLDGRTATGTELATGAAMEMGMPLVVKGITSAYGKMFGNKTIAPIIQNTIQETIPTAKKESIYQPAVPFKIEQPTTNTLQLKSTMLGSPLEKQLSKDGTLSINSLQAHLNNQSTSMADRTMIQKVLDEKFAGQGRINYNDFRKAVSDEMVPLEKNFDSNYSNYGVGSLGYPGVQKSNIEKSIKFGVDDLKSNLKGNLQSDGTYLKDYEKIKWNIDQLRKNKKLLSEIPQENTSIVYSNKDKFGRGSTDHFENEGTLGHSRILVSNEEKDVMHILEQQSDFYQKNSPEEIGMSEELMKNISRLEKDLSSKKDILNKMKTEGIDFYGNPIKPNDIPEMESLIKQQSEINKLANADLSNITQKALLGKTHQDRLLQENVAHAAQNGQTKMRYPTPETAAKIQGYKQRDSSIVEKEITELKNNREFDVRTLSPDTKSFITGELNVKILDFDNAGNTNFTPRKTSDIIADIESKNGFNILKERGSGYSKEHQTILKKYSDNPKMVKKILGQDTRTITDTKGNTWFEFDIPEAFRKGKAEIKALSTIGAVATGYKAIANKNKNKQ